ncbi:hypothetical protein BZG36_02122 [Bifiguratus adelaidae]|uniref:Cytochrome P450 n=1 Tax=Bifiguratus adelaidae TaxID=1938954 RepID=A0A261Y354_9FUNG|nr:hypothetical protein BZG36_02122 [Bifiguratus adelaidae]
MSYKVKLLSQAQSVLYKYLAPGDHTVSVTALSTIGIAGVVLLCVALLGLIGYLLFWDLYIRQLFKKLKGIPSPKKRTLLLGNLEPNRDFIEMAIAWTQECGPVLKAQLLHMRWIITSEPEDIKALLVTDNIQKGGVLDEIGHFWGPNNLLTMHHGPGQPHKAQRSLMNQAFKMKYIRAIRPIFLNNAKLFAEELRAQNGKSIDFLHEITRVTLNIISEVIGAQHAPPEFQASMTTLVHQLNHLLLTFPNGGYLLRHVMFRKHIKIVDKFIYRAIYERIEQRKRGIAQESVQKDYIDILLDAEENGRKFTPTEIKDHLLIFFLAGHETTANTLAWLIYSLCTSPTAETALLKEIDNLPQDMDFDAENIKKMKYAQHCFNETLRLYPPAPATSRILQAPYALPSHPDTVLPKGTEVVVFVYGAQRSPKYWDRADDFWPERWENSPRNPYVFTPFSAGERICIGKNFFYDEAAILIHTIFKTVKIRVGQ